MKFEAIAGLCFLMVGGVCVVGASSGSNNSLPSDDQYEISAREETYEERFPDPKINFDIPDVIAISTVQKEN